MANRRRPRALALAVRPAGWAMGLLALTCLASTGCADPAAAPSVQRWSDLDHWTETSGTPRDRPPPPTSSWQREDLANAWARTEGGERTRLLSPPIEIPIEEITEIQVEATTLTPGAELTLVWSDTPSPDRHQWLRNRRVFRSDEPGRTTLFRLTGTQISETRFDGPECVVRHVLLDYPSHGMRIEAVHVPERDVGTGAFEPIAMHGDIRTATELAPSSKLGASVVLRRGSRLELAVAANEPAACRLRMIATPPGGSGGLLLEEVQVDVGARYRRLTVPLGDLDGPMELVIAVDHDAPSLVFAEPLVLRAPASAAPSVILYVMDALRASSLGVMGAEPVSSPVFDRLAADGVLFTNCLANSSWTKPSVATLLSSTYPQAHQVGARSHGDVMPAAATTIQQVMRQRGALTVNLSANPLASTLSNLHVGFDFVSTPEAFPADEVAGKVTSDVLTDAALEWLSEHGDLPFFLYLHTMDPHPPWVERRLPDGLAASGRVGLDKYRAEVHHNDMQLGRLVSWLSGHGLVGSTLLVVTSDHGQAFGEHGHSGHGTSTFQEEVHVPLLLVCPGRLAPARVTSPVQLLDVAPTILHTLGVEDLPATMAGRDLPTDGGIPGDGFTTRFAYPQDAQLWPDGYQRWNAVRRGRWKLIVRGDPFGSGPKLELFDLEADPAERTNRTTSEPGLAAELLATLRDHLAAQAAEAVRLGAGAEPSTAVDAATRRQLETLGYLEPGAVNQSP